MDISFESRPIATQCVVPDNLLDDRMTTKVRDWPNAVQWLAAGRANRKQLDSFGAWLLDLRGMVPILHPHLPVADGSGCTLPP